MDAADLVRVELRRPRLWPGQILWTLGALGVGLLAALFFSAQQRRLYLLNVLLLLAVAVLLSWLRLWWARRRGGVPPITIGPQGLVLPVNHMSRRVARVELDQVRSVVPIGRGRQARVVVDSGRRLFAYPARAFASADPATELREAIRAQLASHPQGGALHEAIGRRHQAAAELIGTRPLGTWAALAILVLVYACQRWADAPADVLRTVDFGAAAPALVWDGQWFRLVTANLLHASLWHLYGNCLSLLVIGTLVERLVGLRHATILLLATAIASQLVSAAAGALLPAGHLFSVGISGAIFGLLGALAAITWRFGATLPAGLRVPARNWMVLAGLNGVLIPLLVPRIDLWAHGGGLLSGLLLGWLLCRGCPDVLSLRRPRSITRDAFAALLLVAGLGIAADLWHAADTQARMADRTAIAEAVRRQPGYDSVLRNELAWSVAIEPAATPRLLRSAYGLARQATAQPGATPAGRQQRKFHIEALDTEAVLEARLGYPDYAAERESLLPWRKPAFASHFTQILDQMLQTTGPRVLGAGGQAAPAIMLDRAGLRLNQVEKLPSGARLYAVLRGPAGLLGVVFLSIPPGFSGSQVLPLPPGWPSQPTQIDVALFDQTGCRCKTSTLEPVFAAYDPAAAYPQ